MQKEIVSGRLHLFATQLEPSYTIENLIRESHRRIELQELHNSLTKVNRSDLDGVEKHRLNNALMNTQLFLTPGELTFLEQYHHLVEFQTSIDSEQLEESRPIHFIHEFNGGITFARNQRKTAKTIANALSEDAIILSTIKWHTYEDSDPFRIWESHGISAQDLRIPTASQRLAYTLFRKPNAPRF